MLTIQRNGRADNKLYVWSSLSEHEMEAELPGMKQGIIPLLLLDHPCLFNSDIPDMEEK